MHPIGFSTGAVSLGDFRSALQHLARTASDAVELSALRTIELEPLIEALDTLDLTQFRYVAVHAPSSFTVEEEPNIIALLQRAARRRLYVVVHPDAVHRVERWAVLGEWLCLENMDKRKSIGRTAADLCMFFAKLPRAGLCFDIAHARQFDSSMTEAYRILRAFTKRIRQVHLSEVSTSSHHVRVSAAAAADFRQVASLIPKEAAIIVEAPVAPSELQEELEVSRAIMCHPA